MFTEYTVLEDLPYGDAPRQTLDLLLPKNPKSLRGVILFVHPCAWIAGDKKIYRGSAESFCREGYISATTNYRYACETVNNFDQMEDILSALAKIRQECLSRGFPTDRVILSGGSAGAHLSMMVAYTAGYRAALKPVAVVSHCGPSDIASRDFFYRTVFGNGDLNRVAWLYSRTSGHTFTPAEYESARSYLRAVSPVCFVTPDAPPTLMAYGAVDDCVRAADPIALEAALTAAGVRHDFILYPHSGHELEADPACSERVHQLFLSYAEDYL